MMKRNMVVAFVLMLACAHVAPADLYNLEGYWVDVDYWAGSGLNETIVVIDWNNTNGPYTTESHAWGYRWSGTKYLSDAVTDICAAGVLAATTTSGGAFMADAFYYDPLLDADDHTSAGYAGWWWAGETTDGGASWVSNSGGLTTELLGHGKIEGLNMDSGNWTSGTLTIPLPELGSLFLLLAGGLLLARRR